MRFLLPLALAISALAACVASPAAAMSFETISGPEACAARGCVLASGLIGEQSDAEFARFVSANRVPSGALVILDSEGGDLLASLKLGNEIRGDGLATTVAAYDKADGRFVAGGSCASACAYVFLGGVERSVGRDARIGVHQIHTEDRTWAMSAEAGFDLMSLVAVHLQKLCGNLGLLIPALRTRPQEMHWLSASELTRYGVVTTSAGVA